MQNFLSNIWTVTIGSGLIVAFVVFLCSKIFSKGKIDKERNKTNLQSQNMTVNFSKSTTDSHNEKQDNLPRLSSDTIPVLKVKTKVLFIDDEKFKKIANLKKAGWNVIQKSRLDNLDDDSVLSSHVIFVDYKGVGSRDSEEGIGLLKALKKRYGDQKWLILYSAHELSLNVYGIGANSYLAKNSTEYEIEQKIIEGARNILK